MVKLADNKVTGIIGLVMLLAGFGGSQFISQDSLSSIYVCSASIQYGIFYGGISSTGLIAYPYSQNRTGSVKCTGGVWMSLVDYAKLNNVGIESFIQISVPQPISQAMGRVYTCDRFKCSPVGG